MLELTLHVKQIEKDGKIFYSASTEVKGKWFKVKFRMGLVTPDSRGLWHLTVLKQDLTIQNGGIRTKEDGTQYLENDTIWVGAITNLSKFTEAEMRAVNELKVNQTLGL